MESAARRLEAWLVLLASISLAAWSMLALGGGDLSLPAFCSAGALWAAAPSLSLGLALLLNSPAQLAADWALMLAAMMSPLLVAPLRHVRDRSFISRRARAMLLFIAGYATVWMIDRRGAAGHRSHGIMGCARTAALPRRCSRRCDAVAGLARQAVVPEPLPSPAAACRLRRGGRPGRFPFRIDQRHRMRRSVLGADVADALCRSRSPPGDDHRDAVRVRRTARKPRFARVALARRRQGLAHHRRADAHATGSARALEGSFVVRLGIPVYQGVTTSQAASNRRWSDFLDVHGEMPVRVEARRLPTLHATVANGSLTLSAVGSGDTEQPVVGWRDGVCEQKIDTSGH